MSRRREQPWLLLAFLLAVLTHAALLCWLVRVDSRRGPLAQRSVVRVTPAPAIVRVPPEPPKPRETPIGEATGNGDAIAHVDLPNRSQAKDPHDVEQAWTRQRPSIPSPAAAAPSTPLGPIAPAAPVGPPPAPKAPNGSVAELPEQKKSDDATAKPAPARPPEQATAKQSVATPPPSPPRAPDDPGDAGPSDLDPFAKADGVEFKQGGIEARTGRPVKLARPRIDLRFMADATTLSGRSVSVGLRIETDNTGAARDVRVVKSSGSEPIDDAIRLAMYDSWFGGKMPDAFPFGVTLWR